MVLAQAKYIAGYHIVGVADSNVGKARESLARVGWDAARYGAKSLSDAHANGVPFVTDDVTAVLNFEGIDCIIEATGHQSPVLAHALAAYRGKQAHRDGGRRGGRDVRPDPGRKGPGEEPR